MCRQNVLTGTATWLLLVVGSTVMAAEEDRVLFEFGTPVHHEEGRVDQSAQTEPVIGALDSVHRNGRGS